MTNTHTLVYLSLWGLCSVANQHRTLTLTFQSWKGYFCFKKIQKSIFLMATIMVVPTKPKVSDLSTLVRTFVFSQFFPVQNSEAETNVNRSISEVCETNLSNNGYIEKRKQRPESGRKRLLPVEEAGCQPECSRSARPRRAGSFFSQKLCLLFYTAETQKGFRSRRLSLQPGAFYQTIN